MIITLGWRVDDDLSLKGFFSLPNKIDEIASSSMIYFRKLLSSLKLSETLLIIFCATNPDHLILQIQFLYTANVNEYATVVEQGFTKTCTLLNNHCLLHVMHVGSIQLHNFKPVDVTGFRVHRA